MKKEIITVITILIIGLLSGCSMLDDILGHKTYEVSFITNKEATLESINITDFTTYNFNESHIPVVVGEDFLGWYLDDSFNNAYEPNHSYDTDLVLYAQFKPLVFNVSIKDTYTFMTYNYEISYGQTLESIDLYHEGLILVGFKTIDTDLDVAIDDVVTSDLFLYTVFLPIHTHALVNFVVNDDFNIPPQVVLKSSEITMPQIEVLEHQILIGWYKDSSFNQLFDFDELIESNLTLYAKIIDKVETSYSMEDNVLSWDPYMDALSYEITYLNLDETTSILESTETSSIDLNNHASWFDGGKTIKIVGLFNHGLRFELFEVTLTHEYIDHMYHEDFEDDAFTAGTNYANNTTPRLDGPQDFNYYILNGSASFTNPIEGLKSIQLRLNTNTPYLKTNFILEDVAQISFLAKAYHHHLNLKLLNHLDEVLETKTFELTELIETYMYETNISEGVKLLFELVPSSTITTGEQVFIDDIKVFGKNDPKALIEVKKDIEPDPNLEDIKARFETQRNRLTPPGFNALSMDGKLAYYASLNGLTGDDFRVELQNILKTTHRRLISYDEARFILEQSDLVQKDGKHYLDGIYSGHEIIPYWDGGETWAREHVWPNSRLAIPRVGGSSKNQGSDVHNLRAINPSVNSSRSNRYFVSGLSFGTIGTTGYYPGDDYRGDVARILFYMLARYPDILTLRDEDIIDSAYTEEGAVMGILSLLILWHEEDPVSAFEIHRNEVIYTYQGNRNPFIDNPEYVDVYFN